jgi:copper chaperone CopZ
VQTAIRNAKGEQIMKIMKCECSKNVLVEVEWTVPGIAGKSSAEHLQMTLEEIVAVRGVRVNVPNKTVLVGFDADYTSEKTLKEILNMAGFNVAPSREELYRLEIFGNLGQVSLVA